MTTVEQITTPADAIKATGGEPVAPQESSQGERPAWLPEKFNTPEDFAKAYGELETKLGTQQPTTTPDPSKVTPNDKAETQPGSEGQKTTFDFSPFEAELTTSGALSEESYAKLEQMGFSRQMAETYVNGLMNQADQAAKEYYDIAGGKEAYGEMMAWAEKNLPAEAKALVETTYPNIEAAKLAVSGLYARYAAQAEPNLLKGGSSAGGAGYASQAQMLADMGKPEYRNDPAFRNQVDQKILNSTWFPR